MELIHTTNDESIYEILKSGKMKSSSKTKNVRLYGIDKGSKYIYLRLNINDDQNANLYFSIDLLLYHIFYLHKGWNADPIEHKKIDGRKINHKELKILLLKFYEEIILYVKKYNIQLLLISNEILVKNNIKIKNFLKKIKLNHKNEKIIKYIKKYYPNVEIILS